jgi:hypothetical protein
MHPRSCSVGARYVSQPKIKACKSKKKYANAGWYGVGRMQDSECWSVRSLKKSFPDIGFYRLFKFWTQEEPDKDCTFLGGGVLSPERTILGVHASKISPKLS